MRDGTTDRTARAYRLLAVCPIAVGCVSGQGACSRFAVRARGPAIKDDRT
jgi:hypothetical protein